MSKPELVLDKFTAETWGHSDAPECWERGARRCDNGPRCETFRLLALSGQTPEIGKPMRYTQPQSSHAKGQTGRLLCSRCVDKEADQRLEDGKVEAQWQEAEMQRNGLYVPNLRQWRVSRGLNQRQLADSAGISQPFIQQLEKGEKRASAGTVYALARRLEVGTEVLIS